MPYSKFTEFFKIPIPCKGDKILESEETKRMNIIENQLLAGTKGIRCAVYEEGLYRVIDNNDGTFAVQLSASTTNYAFCGIVGGGYAESKETILWNNLNKGGYYYLYIQYSDELYENENAFRLLITDSVKTNSNGYFLLMATLDLKNSEPVLDTTPVGKYFGNDIAAHTTDTIDPHGESLTQTNLVVKNSLILENTASLGAKNELLFKDKRTSCNLSDDNNVKLLTNSQSIIGAINEAFSCKIYTIDVESGGKGGLLLSVKDAIDVLSVEVHEIAQTQVVTYAYQFSNLGQIAIGYKGYDVSVTDNKSFKVYNNGDSGIKIRVRVFYR